MSVQYMSFSAHADAKGIMQLVSWCEPKNVMLVHGEAAKMEFLKTKIKQEFGEDFYYSEIYDVIYVILLMRTIFSNAPT